MHELPLTENLLEIVLRRARAERVRQVRVVHLDIGVLRDVQIDWLQRYFDYLSKDTEAAGARLEIRRLPLVVCCKSCQTETTVAVPVKDRAACPRCGGSRLTVVSGREYRVRNLEVS